MPSFCFPCGPGAAKAHFDTDEHLPSYSTTEKETKPTQDERQTDIQKPTPREYAGDTAKQFLNVLSQVAQAVPLPGLSAAVALATNLVKACDESHKTLERAQELKLRIMMLVALLVNELKEKKKEEIQEKLKKDIEALQQDLIFIQAKLNEIAAQHALLVVFFRGLNEDKVRKCVSRLDSSMERFNLALEISNTNVLDRLEKQIIAFHSNQQKALESLKDDVSKVKMDIGTALSILQSTDPSSSQSRSRAGVPANTDIFYGRDALVDDLAKILTDTTESRKRARVCLLGPGGMGKTSSALATMAHEDVTTCFPDGARVWIPCVKATSFSLFLDTLYESLGITRNTGNTRNDILAELNASEPLLLLLDNFETPWNVDGGRSEAERMLRDIERIPHVTLFLTMRSSTPPCEGIHWHSVDLRAVDADASHHIYSHIFPRGGKNPRLSELLDMIGHMPLAVTMMAKIGRVTRLSAEKLMVEYKRLGTAMLGQGSDAEHSMDLCIGLSVDSPPMQKHPEALELLAILSVLPVGTTYDMLTSTWARSSPNLLGALQVLDETSLIEHRSSVYFVLPVIQRYILSPSRFPEKIRVSMIQSACDFLVQHKSSPGDALYSEHRVALLAEEGNLEAILLETTVGTPELIDALLVLGNHQSATRPRTDLVKHALKLVHAMDNGQTLLALVLCCYGSILVGLAHYDDAAEQFALARKIFLSVSEKARAADCLLQIADIHRMSGNETPEARKAFIEDAKSDFESLNDTRSIAICLLHLGSLHWMEPQYSQEAEDHLINARAMLADFRETIHIANCCQHLGFLYFITARYEDAQTAYTSAIEGYAQMGHYDTCAERGLSRIRILRGDYDGALEILMEVLRRAKIHGNRLDISWTLLGMGRRWAKKGDKADARGAFEESRRYFLSLNTLSADGCVILCDYFIKRLDDPLLIPNSEEKQAWLAGYLEDVEEMERNQGLSAVLL